MLLPRGVRALLTAFVALVLAFVYIPLLLVIVNAFNSDSTFSWPPPSFTTKWVKKAIENPGAREAFATSIKVGIIATLLALVLGTMASFAVGRFSFFGRNTISFIVILPIALPGILTGIALNAAFTQVLTPVFGIGLGLFAIIVGHATFCVVVVYNNVLARLRRTSTSLEEASADLGASTFQTFRFVTFPSIRTALVAGALLAFGLSFDEIIVTFFLAGPGVKTLPLWILDNLSRPNQAPIVNAVAAFVLLLSIIPIYLSQKIAGDTAATSGI